jgi:cytosine/creatinine deaminase
VTAPLLLRGGVGPDGAPLEVRSDPATGLVDAVAPSIDPRPGDEVVDVAGMVVLPGPAEPHAHLDKALSAHVVPNPAGDLAGAIEAWHAYWPRLTEEDIAERALRAVHELVAHGTTAVRTHVDVGPGVGLRAVRALVGVREQLRANGLCDLQVVALSAAPDHEGERPGQLRLLREAMDAGADVVGGVPHLDPDPVRATAEAVALADLLARPIDLHTDETLDADALWLPELARQVVATAFAHGAVASHCVSLGMQPEAIQAAVAHEVAAAGVAVVTLPQTNLYLQARGVRTAAPRGLTAVRALLEAGAVVGAGGDNVRDPFNGCGRSDALEVASLLVIAAHLTPEEAWDAVSAGARRAMGLPVTALRPGAPADLLAVRGENLADAIARASDHRVVLRAGRVVARTEVTTTLAPLSRSPIPVPT